MVILSYLAKKTREEKSKFELAEKKFSATQNDHSR